MNDRKDFQRAVRLLLVLAMISAPAISQQLDSAKPQGGAGPLPSMGFAAMIAPDEIYDALKKFPALATLDKEKLGSPVTVRVSFEVGRPSIASNTASAFLTLATLGLMPAVNNADVTVTYDVLVNGSELSSYSYAKKITRVFNVYSTDRTHGLGNDGLSWLISTAGQFAGDLARDPKFAALIAEYHSYFDIPTPLAAH